MTTPDAKAAEERAKKLEERRVNTERFGEEIAALEKTPIPDAWGFPEISAEHTRLRTKIMEMQQLVIRGRFDIPKSQEYERRLVARIHQLEERARSMQTGRHVPKPGE
ncbi:MAG TPA: hypothetical protein VM889_11005 [Candidatus Thermoplasmatota archaeon]|nr:hypothetical protein [Candidatus Thermoplasmatota archaeon]